MPTEELRQKLATLSSHLTQLQVEINDYQIARQGYLNSTQPPPVPANRFTWMQWVTVLLGLGFILSRIYIGFSLPPEPFSWMNAYKDGAHLYIAALITAGWIFRPSRKPWMMWQADWRARLKNYPIHQRWTIYLGYCLTSWRLVLALALIITEVIVALFTRL